MVSSLGYLHGRAVHLNMLAGGFRNDLLALGVVAAHGLDLDQPPVRQRPRYLITRAVGDARALQRPGRQHVSVI